MKVVLNGERRDLGDGATVREAVTATGAPGEGSGVAVALDGEVVPRRRWDDVPLRGGQRIEGVQAGEGGWRGGRLYPPGARGAVAACKPAPRVSPTPRGGGGRGGAPGPAPRPG